MLLQKRYRYQKHHACEITLLGMVPNWRFTTFTQFAKIESAQVFVLLLPSLMGTRSSAHLYQVALW